MAYFKSKTRWINPPLPDTPEYVPPTPPTPPTPEEPTQPDIPRPIFTGNYSIILMKNNEDDSVYRKNPTTIFTTSVHLVDVDVVNPILRVQTSNDLTDCNYFKLGDYYYFANVTLTSDNTYIIKGHMDGLMCCDLSNCKCSVKKSASNYDTYLRDNIPIESYDIFKTLQFSAGFSKTLKYLLVTIGGANNG